MDSISVCKWSFFTLLWRWCFCTVQVLAPPPPPLNNKFLSTPPHNTSLRIVGLQATRLKQICSDASITITRRKSGNFTVIHLYYCSLVAWTHMAQGLGNNCYLIAPNISEYERLSTKILITFQVNFKIITAKNFDINRITFVFVEPLTDSCFYS